MKKDTSSELNQDISLLKDVWALTQIDGRDYNEKLSARMPLLEIKVKELRFQGNDGCNSFFGNLASLTTSEIKFGPIGSTKMMCSNMEIPKAFAKGIEGSAKYRVDELKLVLLDENGKALLTFKKVD